MDHINWSINMAEMRWPLRYFIAVFIQEDKHSYKVAGNRNRDRKRFTLYI